MGVQMGGVGGGGDIEGGSIVKILDVLTVESPSRLSRLVMTQQLALPILALGRRQPLLPRETSRTRMKESSKLRPLG